jgi:TonB family protein
MLGTPDKLAVMALVGVSICGAYLGLGSELASDSQVSIAPAAFLKAAKVPPLPPCPAKFDDSLETDGVVPEGMVRGVTLPKPLHTPEAEFSDRARIEINRQGLRPFQSLSTIALVVDTDGNPRDLCVKHSSPFDLDEQAAKAVRQYRFEPATKDGHPVSKRVAVEIRFAIR